MNTFPRVYNKYELESIRHLYKVPCLKLLPSYSIKIIISYKLLIRRKAKILKWFATDIFMKSVKSLLNLLSSKELCNFYIYDHVNLFVESI